MDYFKSCTNAICDLTLRVGATGREICFRPILNNDCPKYVRCQAKLSPAEHRPLRNLYDTKRMIHWKNKYMDGVVFTTVQTD